MKANLKLIIFAIIVFVCAYFITSTSIFMNIFNNIQPTNHIAHQILYIDNIDPNYPYTLNIYTDREQDSIYYEEDGELVRNVASLTPNTIKCNIYTNADYDAQKIKKDLNIKSDKFAVLLDSKGYVLSVYLHPYNKQLILSNLQSIHNLYME